MINLISKFSKTTQLNYQFSVLIPSWNNIEYLKLCIEGIQKNSHFNIQIIVIANEAKDGTLEWLQEQTEIDYVYCTENIGICYGLNSTRSLIKSEYVVYMNDDMYPLPDWDLGLYEEIKSINHKKFMLSATMIEPHNTNNPCVVVKDYGDDLNSFKKEQLLTDYTNLKISDWSGSSWPPNVVHIDVWDLVGGMSIEFSPGMYSDPDFSRKLFEAGVRIYKGIGTSLVYHFGSKSTRRVKRNKGKKTFLRKWDISSNTFSSEYLSLGKPYVVEATPKKLSFKTKLKGKFKQFINLW